MSRFSPPADRETTAGQVIHGLQDRAVVPAGQAAVEGLGFQGRHPGPRLGDDGAVLPDRGEVTVDRGQFLGLDPFAEGKVTDGRGRAM